MEEPSWTEHVFQGAAWRRFGVMVLFAPIFACAGFFITFIALFQFLTVLASGETNPHLAKLGRELGQFAAAIIDFLTYNAARPPFPFAPWPETMQGDDASGAAKDSPSATRAKAAPRRKKRSGASSARKTTRRTRSSAKKTSSAAPATAAPEGGDKPANAEQPDTPPDGMPPES